MSSFGAFEESGSAPGPGAGSSNVSAANTIRQQRVIEIAEQLLQDYYTRLSKDPQSLSSLYLDNAEVIYTGKELNVDAVYACGRAEIEDFLKSEAANRFRYARVVVDALHPQASPTSFFGISLFAKGRLYLRKPPPSSNPLTSAFVQTPYVHFVSLAPPVKPGNWGEMPQLYIANEYFHLLNLNLSNTAHGRLQLDPLPQPQITRSINCSTAVSPALPTDTSHTAAAFATSSTEILATSAAMPSAPPATDTDASVSQMPCPSPKQAPPPPVAGRVSGSQRWSADLSPPPTTSDAANRQPLRQNYPQQVSHSTVHAQPGFSLEVGDEQLGSAITECIHKLGLISGSCLHISKPRSHTAGGNEYPYFFIHCDCQDTAQALLATKIIMVLGQEVRLSPQRQTRQTHYPSNTPWNSSSSRGAFRSTLRNLPHRNSRLDPGAAVDGDAPSTDMPYRPSPPSRGRAGPRGGLSAWTRRGAPAYASSSRGISALQRSARLPPNSSPHRKLTSALKNEPTRVPGSTDQLPPSPRH